MFDDRGSTPAALQMIRERLAGNVEKEWQLAMIGLSNHQLVVARKGA